MLKRFAIVLILGLCRVVRADDGFTDLFNGKDLTGWSGDEKLWSVKDGVIIGETTAENPIKHNTFLISKDEFGDFELRLSFKISAHNSGVQYRSKAEDDFVCAGYQADIDFANKYAGILYEEKLRGILALRGQKVTIGADGKKNVTGSLGSEEELGKGIKPGEWNDYVITANGNHLTHEINGVKTVDVIDDQADKRAMSGIIALQLHAGAPMKAEFKNIRIKKLEAAVPATKDAKASAKPEAKGEAPEWIWSNAKAAENEVVYFRKEFDVKGAIAAAVLTGACDNSMKVFVNGQLALTSMGWSTPTVADIKKKLTKGKNVIAVRAQNDGSIAGALLTLKIESRNGAKQIIVSDSSWAAASEGTPGWEMKKFDASHWKPAFTVGKYPMEPWGKILSNATETVAPTDPKTIKLLRGFKADLLYTVPKESQGSWVSMAFDPKGRIIASDQSGLLYRITLPHDGKPIDVEAIHVEIGQAQGLLYAYDSLYVSVNDYGAQSGGVYRVRDTDGDDQFDNVELLTKINGFGEHGPHALRLGPDGLIYHIAGNFTPTGKVEDTSPFRNFAEDQLLPRLPDARGHDPNQKAPASWIIRFDKDGKNRELFCAGMRNAYDFDFNPDGEIFTYDSDMEWDIGAPWYRPTRGEHAVSAGEYGWRNGSGKWPPQYPDSLPGYDIGPGSPTGVCFGTGSKFPQKYQRAFFMMDWSYGHIYAMHFTPSGASYTETHEKFGSGKPLPVTDMAFGPDGALYFMIGGRRTQSALYRISYVGNEDTSPAAPIVDQAAADARKLRHELEEFHRKSDPKAIDFAWPHLDSTDRFIRYAARIAIERQDVSTWEEKALSENRPQASLEALLALARVGPKDMQSRLFDVLSHKPLAQMSEFQQIAVLRIYALSFMRMNKPDDAAAKNIIAQLDPMFPAKTELLNREYCRVLVYLQAPDVVAKSMKLLAIAPTQQEQMHYIAMLRMAKVGWTPALHRQYFEWFNMARKYTGGNSFKGFLQNIRTEAVATLSDDEKSALKEVLDAPAPQMDDKPALPHKFVRDWKMEDLTPRLSELGRGRNFENGETAYAAVKCVTCHSFRVQSAEIGLGPDLTGVGGRFNANDLLESILQPSKVISDQYQNIDIRTKDGDAFSGKIESEDADKILLKTNPIAKATVIQTKNVKSRAPSKLSIMPQGLLSILNEEEILDLLAYLRSGGDPTDKAFQK